MEYKIEESFAKAECLVPSNRKGVQQGFTRWNSTTDYREKPYFRFDGKFVCSVVRMSAGGHHTCLLFGITFTRNSSKSQLASNVVDMCYSRALQHLRPCVSVIAPFQHSHSATKPYTWAGDEECTNCNTGYLECFGWNDYNQSSVPQCFDGGEPQIQQTPGDLDMLLCKYNRPPLHFKDVSAGLNPMILCFARLAPTAFPELYQAVFLRPFLLCRVVPHMCNHDMG